MRLRTRLCPILSTLLMGSTCSSTCASRCAVAGPPRCRAFAGRWPCSPHGAVPHRRREVTAAFLPQPCTTRATVCPSRRTCQGTPRSRGMTPCTSLLVAIWRAGTIPPGFQTGSPEGRLATTLAGTTPPRHRLTGKRGARRAPIQTDSFTRSHRWVGWAQAAVYREALTRATSLLPPSEDKYDRDHRAVAWRQAPHLAGARRRAPHLAGARRRARPPSRTPS